MRLRAERYAYAIIHVLLFPHFLGDPSPLDLKIEPGVVIDENLERLAFNIRASWVTLARRLGFAEAEITEIKFNSRQLSDAAYRMLMIWKQRMGSEATYITLSNALKDVGRMDLGEWIQYSAVVSFVFLTISVADYCSSNIVLGYNSAYF